MCVGGRIELEKVSLDFRGDEFAGDCDACASAALERNYHRNGRQHGYVLSVSSA